MKTQLALIFAAALSLPAFAAEPAAKGDPKAAETIVTQVCAACHGADGNSTMPANPSLAGQGYDYLLKQLANFKSGERQNAIMSGMVASLSPADMKNLAAYFSEKQEKPGTAKDKKQALLGQKIYRGGIQGSARCTPDACRLPGPWLPDRRAAVVARLRRGCWPSHRADPARARHLASALHTRARGWRGLARGPQHLRHAGERRTHARPGRVACGRPAQARQPGRRVRTRARGGRRWRGVRPRSSASRSWT